MTPKDKIEVSFTDNSMPDIKDLAKNNPKDFTVKVRELVEKDKIGFGHVTNLPYLQQNLSNVPVSVYDKIEKREVTTNAFQVLTANYAIKEILAGYDTIPDDTADLVTEISDPKKVTKFARIYTYDVDVDEVKEAMEYPEISATDDFIIINSRRNGRLISITQQAVSENDVGDIINRCNKVGEFLRTWVTETTWKRLTDCYGSATSGAGAPYAYYPKGVQTALYSSSALTPSARTPLGNRLINNPLTDGASLENAYNLFKTFVNENGKPVPISPAQCKIVIPDTLEFRLYPIINSLYANDQLEINTWGPGGSLKPSVKVSRWLSRLNATAWYYGDFKSQFIRKTKEALSINTIGTQTESFVRRGIVFQASASVDCEVGAIDCNHVVQNLAGTTFTVA